jgi:hypothetical protein
MLQAASFVLAIQFAHKLSRDSRCPFGQIDIRKQTLGRFRSHFQTTADCELKEDAKAF